MSAFGTKRTFSTVAPMSVNDPKQTSTSEPAISQRESVSFGAVIGRSLCHIAGHQAPQSAGAEVRGLPGDCGSCRPPTHPFGFGDSRRSPLLAFARLAHNRGS